MAFFFFNLLLDTLMIFFSPFQFSLLLKMDEKTSNSNKLEMVMRKMKRWKKKKSGDCNNGDQ